MMATAARSREPGTCGILGILKSMFRRLREQLTQLARPIVEEELMPLEWKIVEEHSLPFGD